MRIQFTRKLPFKKGYVVCFAVAAIPAFGWMVGYDFAGQTASDAIAVTLAKVGAFGGLSLMAISLLMSGRYVVFRWLFAGLDKMYIAHQYLGVLAVLLLILHPIALSAGMVADNMSRAISMWFNPGYMPVFIGAVALYTLVGLIVWSIVTRARYEVFMTVHRILGVVFILGAVHAFWAGSILADNPFIYWYMVVLCAAAALTFIQYSIFGDLLHRPVQYKVLTVANYADNITEVVLTPKHRMIRFHPGQFVYVRFRDLWEHGYHPFSIASSKYDHNLQLVIRHAGDFSKAIAAAQDGSEVHVRGPFGMFLLDQSRYKKQLWIAGGIGVAPFLSGIRSKARSYVRGQVEVIYATGDADPYAAEELERICHQNPALHCTLFHQEKFGYVSLATLREHYSDFDERDIYICGPPVMLQALLKEAEQMGIKDRLHYEEFAY